MPDEDVFVKPGLDSGAHDISPSARAQIESLSITSDVNYPLLRSGSHIEFRKMATKHEIQILTHSDELHDWTAAQFSAFVKTGNVLHDVLFPPATPPTPAELDLAVARHRATFNAEHNVYIQIVDPTNGKIMGGANWNFWHEGPKLPDRVSVDWIDDSTPQGKAELEFAQKVMDEFTSRRARDMTMPHGLLHLCYCVPEYERRGVATALVSWGLEKVDKEGWVSFLEASRRGRPVYERLGFEEVEVVSLRFDELGDYAKNLEDVYWTYMKRPARGQKDH